MQRYVISSQLLPLQVWPQHEVWAEMVTRYLLARLHALSSLPPKRAAHLLPSSPVAAAECLDGYTSVLNFHGGNSVVPSAVAGPWRFTSDVPSNAAKTGWIYQDNKTDAVPSSPASSSLLSPHVDTNSVHVDANSTLCPTRHDNNRIVFECVSPVKGLVSVHFIKSYVASVWATAEVSLEVAYTNNTKATFVPSVNSVLQGLWETHFSLTNTVTYEVPPGVSPFKYIRVLVRVCASDKIKFKLNMITCC